MVKEIRISQFGSTVVTLPFDDAIMRDFEENIDVARSRDIVFSVIGTDRELLPNSVVGRISSVGRPKQDAFGDGMVRWINFRVTESNINSFHGDMNCWVKVSEEKWNEIASSVRIPQGRIIMIRYPGAPKFKPNDNLYFVYNFGTISFVN